MSPKFSHLPTELHTTLHLFPGLRGYLPIIITSGIQKDIKEVNLIQSNALNCWAILSTMGSCLKP
jgi:hypothetical protein